MFQLMLTLVAVVAVFWLLWGPLGGRDLYARLVRDEVEALRLDMERLEEQLAALPEDPKADDRAERLLRRHYESRRRQLALRLQRARSRS